VSERGPSTALVFPACHRQGGVERVVRELARRLAVTQPVTFVGDRFDPDDMAGVGWAPVGGRRLPGLPPPISFRRRATAALAGRPFDVTVTFGVECPPGDVLVVGSVHRAWLDRSGPVHTVLGDVSPAVRRMMPRHLALLALERSYFSSPRPRAVLAASRRTADEVVAVYGVDERRVSVSPNGYDPHEFNVGVRVECREPQRRRLGWNDSIVILFVANELHRKGFATLVDAVARVRDPRVRIDLVGRASPASYRRRIRQAGLGDRVHWHGPQPDVAEWYAGADLLVLPTRYEPFGNVIIEALATGLPVITTREAGAAAAIVPGVNGLIQQDPTDSEELAGLLRTALDDGQLEHWSRRAGTDLEPFEWSQVATRLRAAVEGVARDAP
jgi:UDP-glucose:(heptosyl)LPS alpha-1,3-glucosyltransferase